MSLEQTLASLKTLGIAFEALQSGAGGTVLVVPEYGRVLGVWSHPRGESALWISPRFLRLLGFGSKDDGWTNPGGDRMWLGPEEELLEEGETVAPALDPGHYRGGPEKTGCFMENKGEARAWKTGATVRFRISRRVRPLDEAHLSQTWGATGLRQAGYEEESTLEVAGNCAIPVWLWNITQVPPGAQVRFPLNKDWGGSSLVGVPGVEIDGNCAVVEMRADKSLRVALSASEAAARILCVEEREPGRAHLVAKRYEPGASGESFVQCRWSCRDGCGEFSCRSPAVGGSGACRIQWKTTLGVFAGRSQEILALAARLGC